MADGRDMTQFVSSIAEAGPGKGKKGKKSPAERSAKDRAQDDQVMGTNNSSIVSKRSVEKLYYPDEPHFFRYFVKKFQRRSPLINRGYHLRLHVIDRTVRNFLRKQDGKPKVVINLGCGYDVLPWQTWTRYAEDCKDVKFLDIDFPDLMLKKRKTVLETEELARDLTGVQTSSGDTKVLLKSDRYAQIGCDLRQLDAIRAAIAELVDIDASSFLFVAEVSITYMETEPADAIIQWASGLGQSEFCLLEQLLPDGPDHPFAKTMLSHFEKLSTPLKSVHKYQTVQDQKDRFLSRGWTSTKAWNLWQAWADDVFLSAEERRKLDDVEPFDEWEEFALFGSHYCIINAGNYQGFGPAESPVIAEKAQEKADQPGNAEHSWAYKENPGTKGQRRFGAAMKVKNLHGEDVFANVMGLGPSSRLSSLDLYDKFPSSHQQFPTSSTGPSSRMCHTITSIGHIGEVLVGGRTSPANPLRDCWLFDRRTNCWEKTYDLPVALYRHAATRLGDSSFALVTAGKTGPTSIFSGWLVYHPEKGWLECEVRYDGAPLEPVFGATLIYTRGSHPLRKGYLAGGMTASGVIADQIVEWTLNMVNAEKPTISFSTVPPRGRAFQDRPLVNRFGAASVLPSGYDSVILIGGVVNDRLLPYENEITVWNASRGTVDPPAETPGLGSRNAPAERRALLVGHSALITEADQMVILGGGATCFSMGTYWNKGPYTVDVSFSDHPVDALKIQYLQTVEVVPGDKSNGALGEETQGLSAPEIISIPQVTIQSAADFEGILRRGQPVVLKAMNLGPCVGRWDLAYISDKAGSERKVVVHESPTTNMDFNAKNFQYVTKTFAEFASEVQQGRRLYLRALSTESPADRPANLADDYPALAEDFILPEQLSFVSGNTFSSVLRISGPVNMWLHYDVMANIYTQLSGTKRLLLFPPTDVSHLSFPPGASSSSIDVFSSLPSLGKTHPQEAVLSPGDVLFIPALWLHTAAPISETSIAVNVFFRDLESGYASGRDVYGNRDLAAYEKGRVDLGRLVKGLEKLPAQAREFYLRRLEGELRGLI